MRKILPLFFLVCMYGCLAGKKDTTVEIIKVDLSNVADKFDMSTILDGVTEIIPLETKGIETIVGEISDIKITNDNIIIADYLTKRIFVFDRSGKYISQIARAGRGPQEYMDISAFDVTNDTTIVIYDMDMRRLNYYDISGKFIKNVDVSDMWCHDLVSFNDKLSLINSSSRTNLGGYRLFELSEDGKFERKLLPFDERSYKNIGWALDHYYCVDNDEMMLYFGPFDTLFMASSHEVGPRYFVEFSEGKISEEKIRELEYHALRYTQTEGLIKGIDKALLLGDKIWINFHYKDDYMTTIYDRITKTTQTYKNVENPELHAYSYKNMKSENGLLISWLEPTWLKLFVPAYYDYTTTPDTEFDVRVKKVIETIADDDNYVVFIQKLKPKTKV